MTAEHVRLCPVCERPLEELLLRGVEVDACTDHGLWLDNGELERIQFQKFLDDSPKRAKARKNAFRRGRREGRAWWGA